MPESVRRIAGVGLGAGEAVKLSGSFASHMPHPNLLFELGRWLSLGLRRAAATLCGQNRYPPIAKTDRGAPGGGIKPKGHGSSVSIPNLQALPHDCYFLHRCNADKDTRRNMELKRLSQSALEKALDICPDPTKAPHAGRRNPPKHSNVMAFVQGQTPFPSLASASCHEAMLGFHSYRTPTAKLRHCCLEVRAVLSTLLAYPCRHLIVFSLS